MLDAVISVGSRGRQKFSNAISLMASLVLPEPFFIFGNVVLPKLFYNKTRQIHVNRWVVATALAHDFSASWLFLLKHNFLDKVSDLWQRI